jgi:hypothetical protein
VPRAVGATPGPNVGRPTGAEFGPGVERPTGASFGFTFRPLFEDPFRAGDRFPRNEAQHAGEERTDLSTEEFPPRFDLLTDGPERFQPLRFDLVIDAPLSDRLDLLTDVPAEGGRPDLRIDAPQGDREELQPDAPERFQRFRSDLSTEAPAPPPDDRRDLLTDTPLEVPVPEPPAPPPPGPIVGGTFTGGITGTLSSGELDADRRLATWRLFDDPEYHAARFATPGPLPRNGPLMDREWIVSGYANLPPAWSALTDEGGWTLRGRAGYTPDWSALSPRWAGGGLNDTAGALAGPAWAPTF